MPNYVQYFDWNIVEGVAERLKVAGWRWMKLDGGWNELGEGGWSSVELGARFSNTHHENVFRSVTYYSYVTRYIYVKSLILSRINRQEKFKGKISWPFWLRWSKISEIINWTLIAIHNLLQIPEYPLI